MNDRVERRPLRQGPEPKADQQVFAERGAALLPFLLTGRRYKWKIVVQRAQDRLGKSADGGAGSWARPTAANHRNRQRKQNVKEDFILRTRVELKYANRA